MKDDKKMKKGLYVLKNIFLAILFIGCILTLTLSSCLTLNRNEYGYTQFGDKVLVIIDKGNSGDGYRKGQLVVVKNKKLIDFDGSDEIFIYNTEDDKVSVSHSKIVEINKAGNKAIVFLENGRELTTDDVVVGERTRIYSIGNLVAFLHSKWGFISSLVLCFIILVYLAISIFYGKSKDKISDDEKFVINEDTMKDVSVMTIVEATDNEPLKVKSDDFTIRDKSSVDSNNDNSIIEDENLVGKEVISSESMSSTELEPIILEGVNKNKESNMVEEELTLDEDDDVELI